MDDKILQLGNEIFGKPHIKKISWSLFLVTESVYLYIKDNVIQFARQYSIDENWNNVPERGDLLDRFAKMEFLVNELLRSKLVPLRLEGDERILEIIRSLSISKKISYLSTWKIIDKKTTKLIQGLFHVRNKIAHEFDSDNAQYDERILSTYPSWKQFRHDLVAVWKTLVQEYLIEEEKIDFEELRHKIMRN